MKDKPIIQSLKTFLEDSKKYSFCSIPVLLLRPNPKNKNYNNSWTIIDRPTVPRLKNKHANSEALLIDSKLVCVLRHMQTFPFNRGDNTV